MKSVKMISFLPQPLEIVIRELGVVQGSVHRGHISEILWR